MTANPNDETLRMPEFFVIGAPKAGTTFLYKMLSVHPGVFMSPIKEPNHFCEDLHPLATSSKLNDRVPLDIDAYLATTERAPLQSAWIEERRKYCRLFENALDHQVRGESSTSYMYSAVAAARIAEARPDARIIAILRPPEERAFSHYMMDRRIGITASSFREEVMREVNDPSCHWGNSRLYLSLGRYAEQLDRYYRCFQPEQILILDFAQLRSDPTATLGKVLRFLGVAESTDLELPDSVNKKALARFPGVNRLLHRTMLKRGLRSVLPAGIKTWLRKVYFVSAADEALDPADGELVRSNLAGDTKRLAERLADETPGWVRNGTQPTGPPERGGIA